MLMGVASLQYFCSAGVELEVMCVREGKRKELRWLFLTYCLGGRTMIGCSLGMGMA